MDGNAPGVKLQSQAMAKLDEVVGGEDTHGRQGSARCPTWSTT